MNSIDSKNSKIVELISRQLSTRGIESSKNIRLNGYSFPNVAVHDKHHGNRVAIVIIIVPNGFKFLRKTIDYDDVKIPAMYITSIKQCSTVPQKVYELLYKPTIY